MNLTKSLSKRRWLVIAMTCLTLGFALIARFTFDSPHQQSNSTPLTAAYTALYKKDKPKAVRAELPVRLKIPRIDVDADIEYVALTIAGDMDVPKGPNNAAWFAL
ncbi:MAG: hypothetical protein WD887_02975, partial [Candidatus Saccharimonadales bacterium]